MEETAPFFRLGKLIHRRRIPIILVWILLVFGCLPFIPDIVAPFKTTGFVDETSSSAKADRYLNQQLGSNNNKILITYYSSTLLVSDKQFIKKIHDSLSKLKNYPIAHDIVYPENNKKQFSNDKHTAVVIIIFKTKETLNQTDLTHFKSLITKPTNMIMNYGGMPIFIDDINEQTQKDLYNADLIAAPVSILTLLLIFGSVVAAMVPIFLGGACALIILTSLYFLGHAFTLSIFTLNIALLLGLCLSLDYSLFVISRFRDELTKQKSVADAISITLNTAGKAVFFSGLAVFISLSALLFFPVNILFSVGIGGLVAVFIAVLISIVLLPAILAVLKQGINWLPVKLFNKKKNRQFHCWRSLAETVVKRPIIFFISSLAILLLCGYPFLNVKWGIADSNILPTHSQSRQFFDHYKTTFNEHELTPIIAIISTDKDSILSRSSLEKLILFSKKLRENPAVLDVNSIVTTDKLLTKNSYYTLYHLPKKERPAAIKQLLDTTTREQFTMLSIISKYPNDAAETKKLIAELKKMNPGKNMHLQITGIPVNNVEVLAKISSLFPWALLWIIALTYLILLVLLRSLFLPLKAILMNIVSLSASYGVLVFIFQEGHLHELLHFNPQGMLDTCLLIIIFCALFGFSMDYEVFLLTRIKECYEKTHDNNTSIIFGIDQSSRIITSAALIVICICGSFMVADVLMVKEFGLGIAVAIFVDAFLVRSILVPATMVLVKRWNWYLPVWLNKRLPRW